MAALTSPQTRDLVTRSTAMAHDTVYGARNTERGGLVHEEVPFNRGRRRNARGDGRVRKLTLPVRAVTMR